MGKVLTSLIVSLVASGVWAQGPSLKTRWAAGVTPENAHREYPRPQMVRKGWVNLNGLWDLRIVRPSGVDVSTQVLVPFPVGSQLSRVAIVPTAADTLIYSRRFSRPPGERVLLHFGASDWETTVEVNGQLVGEHKGGYDPFTFDITDALTAQGEQSLTVRVTDPTDTGTQPRGKQVLKPGGIFYTPTSGIWQTVWLEGVPNSSIEGVHCLATNDGTVRISIDARWKGPLLRPFKVEITDAGQTLSATAPASGTAVIRVQRPRLWSPEHPELYPVKVRMGADEVTSYFAFREVGMVRDAAGQLRIALNGKPYFMVGPLDQGFWPDGLYTAPSDDALKYDLLVTKRLGFNMIRKHVKVEPERWYYWCDRVGIAVFQDMPSGDAFISGRDPDIRRTPESAEIYMRELKAMISARREHPSIVAWVPYNEGWGQWDTAKVTDWIKAFDPTRLVDSASGWTDRGVGDLNDVHVYPGPGAPRPDPKRALFLGEFGGLGLPVPSHMWLDKGWGYQSFKTKEELTSAFVRLFTSLRFLAAKPGLSGAVYTQTTDVETELNGFMTYDRAEIKIDENAARTAVQALFLPPPTVTTLVPTAQEATAQWEYTTQKPGDGWMDKEVRGSWKRGPGGFGTPKTPGSIVRTRWDSSDLWLRRTFHLDADYDPRNLLLSVSHDDDAEVYVDGRLLYRLPGYTSSYQLMPFPSGFRLTKGSHVLAIHCHQIKGGQYVDAGIMRVR